MVGARWSRETHPGESQSDGDASTWNPFLLHKHFPGRIWPSVISGKVPRCCWGGNGTRKSQQLCTMMLLNCQNAVFVQRLGALVLFKWPEGFYGKQWPVQQSQQTQRNMTLEHGGETRSSPEGQQEAPYIHKEGGGAYLTVVEISLGN